MAAKNLTKRLKRYFWQKFGIQRIKIEKKKCLSRSFVVVDTRSVEMTIVWGRICKCVTYSDVNQKRGSSVQND